MTGNKRVYAGPSARRIGHRKYDELLKQIIRSVGANVSREELIVLLLEKLPPISTAKSIVVLMVSKTETGDGEIRSIVSGYDQRGVHPDRWRRFQQANKANTPEDSLIHRVIENGLEINVWGGAYMGKELEIFRPLFDIGKGTWISGIQLPRATARHNNQGIFLWYRTGKHDDKVPPGAEQDWRLLSFFQECYSMAGYNIRKVARNIIMQRQELLRTLTPSILNHEINARISFFRSGLENARDDIEFLTMNSKIVTSDDACRELLENTYRRISKQLLPHADSLSKISESVMGLTRRIASGPTDPLLEIRSALELLGHKAADASVLIEPTNCPDEPIEITSDPALLMHVIVNLVKNAIEALEDIPIADLEHRKRIWVNVEWSRDESAKMPLSIEVCDNGEGVPPDQKDRIFESGITTKKRGHGLGLSICKMIANYLGGDLELTNAQNPTVFCLRLPKESPKIADLEEELKNEAERP